MINSTSMGEKCLALMALLCSLAALEGCEASRPRAGAEVQPAHHTGAGFRNLHIPLRGRRGDFFRWRLGLGPQEAPALTPAEVAGAGGPEVSPPDFNSLKHAQPEEIQVTWIGHSTFLIQTAGLNILTDPQFSERASPVGFAGPRRLLPPGISLTDLPPIDLVLVSHNHYDHLDRPTVLELQRRFRPRFVAPLGLKSWFAAEGIGAAIELDWWNTADLGTVRVTCVPAQHFSIRTPFDANRTLWGGFVVDTPAGRILFAGDTGYSPDFRVIGERLGPMRLALIPIGGYMPRWFMQPMHVNPPEAVQIHRDVRARQSIGMHWGTFPLTEEPLGEPPVYLRKARAAAGLAREAFITVNIGETRVLER